MRLYRAPFSTNVERVALALAHKGREVASVGDAERRRAALGRGEDEKVAGVLAFACPAKFRRDPESLPAAEWVGRADRQPFDEVVQEL